MRVIISVLCAACMTACGMATGARAYYICAYALFIMPAYALISTLAALLFTKVNIKANRTRTVRNGAVNLFLSVRYNFIFPVGTVKISVMAPDPVDDITEFSCTPVPFVNNRRSARFICRHRGVYRAGVTKITVKDIFGMFSFSRRVKSKAFDLCVLPIEGDIDELMTKGTSGAGEGLGGATDDTSMPSDTRAWTEGDPLKRVHWKLSARRRELIVRVFEDSAKEDVLIIPDFTPVGAIGEIKANLEDAVCECTLACAKRAIASGYNAKICLSKDTLDISSADDLGIIAERLMREEFTVSAAYSDLIINCLNRLNDAASLILISPDMGGNVASSAIKIAHTGIGVNAFFVCDGDEKYIEKSMSSLMANDINAGSYKA